MLALLAVTAVAASAAAAQPLPPLPPRFAGAGSVVTARPPDARATDANDAVFGVVGNGIADDTAALQRALFAAYLAPGAPDCTLPGARVVLLRGDGRRYRVSDTLRLPIWLRLVGYGNASRPVVFLASNTSGFGALSVVKAVLQVVDWTPDPNPDRRPSGGQCNVSAEIGGDTAFGTGILNVDVEVAAGNPAAVAVSNGAAQGGALRSMRFDLAPDALAAIFTPGWAHEGLVVAGGRFALLLFYTTWPSTVRDSAFLGQAEAAIAWQGPAVSPWEGVVVLRSWFGGAPAAVDATNAYLDSARATLVDCVFRAVGAVALLPALATPAGRGSVVLERCSGDATPLLLGAVAGALDAVPAPAGGADGAFAVAHLVAGALAADVRGGGAGNVSLAVRAEVLGLAALPAGLAPDAQPPPPETPPTPPSAQWLSALDAGLVGDGAFDNAPALAALLARSVASGPAYVYFPQGVYAFRSTVELPAPRLGPLHLFGLSVWDTVLTLADGVFADPARPQPFLRALAGGAFPTWISGLNIRTGFAFGAPQPPPVPAGFMSPNPGAIALWWEAQMGGLQDVFFHPNTFPDNPREGNSPNEELSLVVANGGAGVFADIWSCNAYSAGGVRVFNTTGPVVFSQLSSEHHLGHELHVTNATGVVVRGMQTEDRGDSAPTSSVLLEAGSSAIVQGLFSYYTAGVESPGAVVVDASSSAVVEVYRQYHSYHPLYYACSVLAGDACVAATDFALANVTLASAASDPSAAERGVAPPTDYGLRGLATTWETDDDNSIMQLVAMPVSDAGAKVQVIGPFHWYDSPENSNLPLLPCAMAFDAGGNASRAPVFYFATGNSLGPVRIYVVDAVRGVLTRNVSVRFAEPLAVTAMAFNSASGLLDALVFIGPEASAAPAVASIDPTTGQAKLLASKLALPDFQGPCEASVAPHVRAGSRLYFVQQTEAGWQKANETFLMTLDFATGNLTRLVPWSPRDGMLSNVAALDAAAPEGDEILLYTTSAWDQDLNETAALTLWAVDPAASGATAAVVAVIENPQAGDGPLLPTWGTLSVFGAGAGRTVSMLATNNNGRIYTYVIEMNVTVSLHGVVAAGAPVITKIDDSDVTGGMIYRMNRVVA